MVNELVKLIKLSKDFKRNEEKARRDLEARAKPLYELVHEETFEVQEVEAENYAHSVRSHSKPLFQRYSVGYSTRTKIKVKPDNKIPVRTLTFEGYTSIQKGDRITAVIPRYETHREERGFSDWVPHGVIYTDRPYKADEEAIAIRKLGNKSKEVLRTDLSTNYESFRKE